MIKDIYNKIKIFNYIIKIYNFYNLIILIHHNEFYNFQIFSKYLKGQICFF
jgi:hypothetical protein